MASHQALPKILSTNSAPGQDENLEHGVSRLRAQQTNSRATILHIRDIGPGELGRARVHAILTRHQTSGGKDFADKLVLRSTMLVSGRLITLLFSVFVYLRVCSSIELRAALNSDTLHRDKVNIHTVTS